MSGALIKVKVDALREEIRQLEWQIAEIQRNECSHTSVTKAAYTESFYEYSDYGVRAFADCCDCGLRIWYDGAAE